MLDKKPMGRFIKWWSIKGRSIKLLSFIVFAIISVSFVYGLAIANDNIRAALISVVAIASVTLYSNWQIKKREREARFFTDKRAAYQRFADLLFDMAKSPDKNINHNKIRIEKMDLAKYITIWGNADMIKAYNKFSSPVEEQAEPINPFWRLEDLLLAIRKDLGHDDSSLDRGDLVGIMIDKKARQDLMGKNKQ